MTDRDDRPAPGRTRRELLRLAGAGAIALGAGSILSYGDASEARTKPSASPPPRRSPIAGLRAGAAVVYSTHTPATVQAVLQRYVQAYPEEYVELVHLGAADAVRRVAEERDEPLADVWIHPHATDLVGLARRGVLRPFDSKAGAELPRQHRDNLGRWYAVGLRPQVIAYNRRILAQSRVELPSSVLDLADRVWRSNSLGDWKGEAVVGLPDPTRPSTTAWLASVFTAVGLDNGALFLKTLRTNGAGIPGGDAQLLDAMAAESYAIGPVEAPALLARIAAGDDRLDFLYPEQDPAGRLTGVWMNPTVVTLLSDTHRARQPMNFLLSAEATRIFVEEGFELPAAPTVEIPKTHGVPRAGLRVATESIGDLAPATEAVREALTAWGL